MTFRLLRVGLASLNTAFMRPAYVAAVALATCPAAHADKQKAPPPPRAAPQLNRPAPQGFGGGRPGNGAMGQQSGVHIPNQQSSARVPGQPGGSAGYGGAAGERSAGSPTLHVPSSLRPPPNGGNALVHPVAQPSRPAPIQPPSRPKPAVAHAPVAGKPGPGKPGATKPDTGKLGEVKQGGAGHAIAANAKDLKVLPHDPREGDSVHERPDHPAASDVHVSRANVPIGRPRPAYPVHDAAAERATLQTRTHDFHTHDVAGFSGAERARWSHGAWSDGWHYGRQGWWWQVDGVWYPYAAPVYPYPEVVDMPAVYDGYVVDAGVGSREALPPEMAQMGSPLKGEDALGIDRLPATQLAATHCNDPEGDYPDVRRCMQPWVAR